MRTHLFALFLFLFPLVASAQWQRSLSAEGGWNFKRGNSENVDFKLSYSDSNLTVGTHLFFGHDFRPSSEVTSILDAKKQQDEYYKSESEDIENQHFNAGAGVSLGYRFNRANALNASVDYRFNRSYEASSLLTERFNNADRSLLNGSQLDSAIIHTHTLNTKIAFSHHFDRPDARLSLSLSSSMDFNSDVNRRLASGSFYDKSKNYTTHSNLNDFLSLFSASYSDRFLFNHNALDLVAGFDLASNQEIDGYSAENFVNGDWRDSADYRQSYFYNALALEPFVNLSFSFGKLVFFLNERVQFFRHLMLDKLDGRRLDEYENGLFDKVDVKNLLAAGASFRFNETHSLSLDYGHTISRPDYKKLCPTVMIGESDDECFIGNPDLLPESTDKVNLAYTYSYSIFVTRLDLSYSYKNNTAEKVIDLNKSDISPASPLTIYTWINNKRKQSYSARIDLKMNGEDILADIWAGFNYDIFGNNQKTNKEDFNYVLGTSIDVSISPSAKLSSRLVYTSAKMSAYSLKGENVWASLRFTKTIVKGLDIYAELSDIVDRDGYEETWNADMNYIKVSTTKNKNRFLLIGLNYLF